MSRLTQLLKERLREKRLLQQDLAMMIGTPTKMVSRIMTRQRRLTPEMALRIEKVLDVPALHLLMLQLEDDLLAARRKFDGHQDTRYGVARGHAVRDEEAVLPEVPTSIAV